MEKQSRTWLWIIAVLAAVLVWVGSAVAGAILGGMVGFAAGRWTASSGRGVSQPPECECPEVWPWEEREGLPWQVWPEVPEVPRRFLSGTTGALIQKVVQDSPADQAGLRRGDVILAVNDEQVTAERSLPDIIGNYRPGDSVRLTVQRGLREMQIEVRLGENPDHPDRGYLGVYVVALGVPEAPVR